MKKIIGKFIWTFSEFFYLPLGKYAPTVFGWMINSKNNKKIK